MCVVGFKVVRCLNTSPRTDPPLRMLSVQTRQHSLRQGSKLRHVSAPFKGVRVQLALTTRPSFNSEEQALCGTAGVSRRNTLQQMVRAVTANSPRQLPTPLQFNTCCSDELMSTPSVPQEDGPRPCAQKDLQYCRMCWLRLSVQWFAPSLSPQMNATGKSTDDGNSWEREWFPCPRTPALRVSTVRRCDSEFVRSVQHTVEVNKMRLWSARRLSTSRSESTLNEKVCVWATSSQTQWCVSS